MSKIKIFGVLFVILTFMVGFAFAADDGDEIGSTKSGEAGAQYLEIGIDARAIGMSDAIVALVDDSTATYWNPAGLVNVDGTDFTFSDVEWLSDVRVMTGTFAHTFNFGTIGALFTLVTMDEMDVTDEKIPEWYTGETFSCSDMVIGGSFARRFIPEFSVGVSAKFLREKIYNYTATGVAFDMGIQYYTGISSLKLGFAITNFGPDMSFDGTYDELQRNKQDIEKKPFAKYKLPIALRLGVAYTLFENNDMHTLNLAFDTLDPTDGEPVLNMGAEYWIKDMAALRFGYSYTTGEMREMEQRQYSFGGGVKLSKIRFDAAYTNFGDLKNVYRATFGVSF